MVRRPRITETVGEALDEIKDDYELKKDEQAIRHLLRKEGYDV